MVCNQLGIHYIVFLIFQPAMTDTSESVSDVLESTSSGTSSWLPFCVGMATSAAVIGGVMVARHFSGSGQKRTRAQSGKNRLDMCF